MTMTTTSECIHEMDPRTCSICRKAAGYRPGTDRHENDCTVMAVVNLTGAEYEEALDLLRDAGRRNGRGAHVETTRAALAAAGFSAEPTPHTIDTALADGGDFLVSAKRGNRGHAFTIQGGELRNEIGFLRGGCRYLIFRVR